MNPSSTTLAVPGRLSSFEAALECAMVALLAFAALAFGAVEAWSELVVIVLAGAMLTAVLLRQVLRPAGPLVWSWTYLPVAVFVLLAAGQLVPLPVWLVRVISPHTAEVKTALLSDLPGGAPRWMTLSFYPAATKHDLRLVLAAAAVFFVTVNVFRRGEQVRRLLTGIVIVGAGIAVLALAQVATRATGVYWTVPSPYGRATAGSFLNYSHFSQFMNLAIGAALGLLIVRLRDGLRAGTLSFRETVEHLTAPSARPIWCLAGVVILAAASVLLSLSRAGAVSLLIATAFTTVVVAAKRALSGRGWFMALVAMAAFLCVLYVGFDAVYQRLATLQNLHEGYGSRWQIVRDVAVAWTRFPLLGAGLGTHAVVYPMFDRSTIAALATHAENEYAQAAEEMGILGLGALACFAALIWRDWARCVRRLESPIRFASLGLGFGLLAVMLHSFTDFGQHLPANACLTAVFCGLLVTLARRPEAAADQAAAATLAAARRFRPVPVVALALIACVWGWSVHTADAARRAEAHWTRAVQAERRLVENAWLGTNEEFASLIAQAAAAADAQDDDIRYRHWLNVYRWNSISRVSDPQTGAVVLTPRTCEFTARIVRELSEARALCPTFGPTYCVLGQLEKHVLNRPEGVAHIRTGYALAPYDATTCFVAGHLDAQEGKLEDSLAKFRRMLKLRPGMFPDAAGVYVHEANRPDLALALAGQDVHCLLHLVKMLGDSPDQAGPRRDVQTRALAELKAQCDRQDTAAGTLAATAPLCKRTGDHNAAIAYYRRALAVQYEQVHWRLDLARTLAEAGKLAEALHETRVCLRLRPEMDSAKVLLADLSVRPDATTP